MASAWVAPSPVALMLYPRVVLARKRVVPRAMRTATTTIMEEL